MCRLKNGAKLKENREQKIHWVKSTRNAAACTEIKGAQVDSDGEEDDTLQTFYISGNHQADLKVLVVEAVVLVELVEEAGEVLGPGELVHVQEGLVRGGLLVVLQPRAHRDRENVVPEPVHEELLRDVILAVELQTKVHKYFSITEEAPNPG